MRILLISYLEFSELPPATSLLSTLLDLGHRVSVVTLAEEPYVTDRYGERIEQYIPLMKEKRVGGHPIYSSKLTDKVKNRINAEVFRRQEQADFRKASEKLKGIIKQYDLVWVLHESTAKYTADIIMQSGVPYFFTVYELDNNSSNQPLLMKFGRQAKKVIVPEYCRAHIMKAWWGLDRLPEIIPNKPSEDLSIDSDEIRDEHMREVMNRLQGKKVILYQGIFLPERKLDTFAEAIAELGDEYAFAVMGHSNIHLERLLEKYPNQISYVGFANPPEHLAITKRAYIGILTYVATSNSINPLFCAPNKVFEYAKYGVPMIGNDIPGLKFLLPENKMGLCVDIEDKNAIVRCIKVIEQEHEQFAAHAKDYYQSVNLPAIIQNVLE